METVRECGCKGIRSCLICESEYKINKPDIKSQLQKQQCYVYCPDCDTCWPGWDENIYKEHPHHRGNPTPFPGVYIKLDFLSREEASALMKSLDDLPWEASQSGRRKQNFGPKCNFKKRRLRVGEFNGFPCNTRFIQETKFPLEPWLKDFQTVEQCTLEYDPNRGASIDPHIDDCWVWGERIVTVNVLGDSVLTMTPYLGSTEKYNLEDVRKYAPKSYEKFFRLNEQSTQEDSVFRLPMPQGSLMILYGAARYKWEHCVLRDDITSRRVCLAYRELTPPYLENPSEEVEEILRRAKNFF